MKTKIKFTSATATALLMTFAGTLSAIDFGNHQPAQKQTVGLIVCNVCGMRGVKDVDLAREQRALAKATGKKICPNCVGLPMSAKFNKDGTIFQGERDFVCSGCEKKQK